jgi:superfamily II DNA helicase RecQ
MSEDDDLLFGDDDDDQDLLDACSLADADAAEVNSGPTSTHLQKLQRFFGHDKFRDLQWDIISSLVDEGDANRGRDYCIVMATGYGKSLCYQFPPVFLCKTALVVSPLIALMEDQVLGLETTGIRACFLGSAQKDKDTVYKNVKEDKYR